MCIKIAVLSLFLSLGNCDGSQGRKPNFIVILTDDQGYSDLGCFGSAQIKTPRLDQMAREGMRFTSFYAQTVCGPSRAALMTGCYPLRVAKRNNQVDIHPFLHTEEITIAELLRDAGYATACFGKWDLAGHTQKDFDGNLLPTDQGFDYFFGTPTSNDAVVNLLINEEIIEKEADMSILTRRYTDSAIAFIQRNMENPFFVYIPHTMPHLQLGASDPFLGQSERGLYGDVIEEIDWNVGRLLDALKEMKLDGMTYIIFTSDNGPWFLDRHPGLVKYRDQGGSHGGSALPLRGAKTSTWEGGLRVPCIMRAPGKIPAGTVCNEIASTLDILPTLCKLAGCEVPADRVIDGHDISGLMHGREDATNPTKAFLYYQHTHLQAIRSGRWKLHLPRPAEPPWTPGWAVFSDSMDVFHITSPLLYDLEKDIGEKNNVADKHSEIVNELLELAEQARNDIGDYDQIGRNARFFDSQPARPDIQKWKDLDQNEEH
jgi:arylsulfatase A-like enzyme